MTNYQKIEHVTRPFIGQLLTAQQIIGLVLAEFPSTPASSVMPADCAHAHLRYADRLFVVTGRSQYRVLADSEITRRPVKRNTANVVNVTPATAAGLSDQQLPDYQIE